MHSPHVWERAAVERVKGTLRLLDNQKDSTLRSRELKRTKGRSKRVGDAPTPRRGAGEMPPHPPAATCWPTVERPGSRCWRAYVAQPVWKTGWQVKELNITYLTTLRSHPTPGVYRTKLNHMSVQRPTCSSLSCNGKKLETTLRTITQWVIDK